MRQSRVPMLAGVIAALSVVSSAAGQTKVALSKPDAESKESFTRVTAVRELPSGKVLVVDQQDKVVQLVDLASGTMTKVGREGQGPGEYGLPLTLLGLPSGETLVFDMAGRRFLTIGVDGKPGAVLEMPRAPAATGQAGPIVSFGFTIPRGIDSKGRIYFEGSPFTPTGGSADSVPILRWDRVKPVFDTVGYLTLPKGSAVASGGGGRFSVQIGGGKVWTPAEAWDVAGDGRVARLTPSPYRVIWLDAGKATPGPVQPYTPIKVTEADKALYKVNLAKAPRIQMTFGGPGGGTRSSSTPQSGPPQAEPEFSETMPPFTGRGAVLATPEGEAWVLRTRSAGDKVPTYDVFDRTGALVKKVMLNPSSRVVGFGKGTVYVARIDDDDLQYLQRYKKP
ncbi:MAG TPA: hypothetical protein VGP87_14945 [Gemmatimonadales bacterium]|nr:hypothetical protein [Gemmatimonadales bacterium]